MNEPRLETFLARLYTEADTRSRFLENPLKVASDYGLSALEATTITQNLDKVGLILAGRSFDRKRSHMQMNNRNRTPSIMSFFVRQLREFLQKIL